MCNHKLFIGDDEAVPCLGLEAIRLDLGPRSDPLFLRECDFRRVSLDRVTSLSSVCPGSVGRDEFEGCIAPQSGR